MGGCDPDWVVQLIAKGPTEVRWIEYRNSGRWGWATVHPTHPADYIFYGNDKGHALSQSNPFNTWLGKKTGREVATTRRYEPYQWML